MPIDANRLSTAATGTFVSAVFSDSFTVESSDINMVALDLVAGNAYNFDVDGEAADDLFLRIFDPLGNEVKANDDGQRFTLDDFAPFLPWTDFAPNYSGRYTVAISRNYINSYDPEDLGGRLGAPTFETIIDGTLTVTDLGSNALPVADMISVAALDEGTADKTDTLANDSGRLRALFTGEINTGTDVDMARVQRSKGDVLLIDVNGLVDNGKYLRVFDIVGNELAFDDDSGTFGDPELVFVVPSIGALFFAVSGEGNEAYDPVDGTGTLEGVTGAYEVIIHTNPTLFGTKFAGFMTGTDAADYIVARADDDTVTGGDGNDTLAGGDDEDELSGENGRDVLYGETGDDSLYGGESGDVLVGGLGIDLAYGGTGNDLIEGNAGTDSLFGEDGDDTLSGGSENDSLNGALGDDALSGGLGNDRLTGGDGNDTLTGELGNDNCRGGEGDDLVIGGLHHDRLTGDAGDDRLEGQQGRDTLSGSAGADGLYGGKGTDVLDGGTDDDLLCGGTDDDTLQGGTGNDTLDGGDGDDRLAGGEGADSFVFSTTGTGTDLIADADFAAGDVIDLSAIFDAAGSTATAGNLSQFVQATAAGGGADSFLGIDADGLTGGLAFVIVAQVTGVTAAQLFVADNFLL